MFLEVRVIISESFVQKDRSQEQLLNLETQSDVFFGPPCIMSQLTLTPGFLLTVSSTSSQPFVGQSKKIYLTVKPFVANTQ